MDSSLTPRAKLEGDSAAPFQQRKLRQHYANANAIISNGKLRFTQERPWSARGHNGTTYANASRYYLC